MRCAGQLLQRVFGLLVILPLVIVVVAEDSGNDDAMYYNEFTVCADTTIAITEIQLLCDSPGTYYYGSQKYRNSADCQGGDKARLEVEFQITEDLEADAYMTMLVKASNGVSNYRMYSDETICDISDITNEYGYGPCADGGYPTAGYYKIQQQFYWDEDDDQHDDDGYVGFTPLVVIGIASNQGEEEYDLGGANTDACRGGDTDTQYTQGVAKTAVNTIGTFLKTFGILVGCVGLIVGTGWLVLRIGNAKAEEKKSGIGEELLDDSANDDRKVAMVGQNNDLVNF